MLGIRSGEVAGRVEPHGRKDRPHEDRGDEEEKSKTGDRDGRVRARELPEGIYHHRRLLVGAGGNGGDGAGKVGWADKRGVWATLSGHNVSVDLWREQRLTESVCLYRS